MCIYIVTVYGKSTGGIELCHQLVDILTKNKKNAYIVYLDENNNIVKTNKVNPNYLDYEIKVADTIDDHENNIVVLPEIYFNLIRKLTFVKVYCWWMSVDNFFGSSSIIDFIHFNIGIHKLGFLRNLARHLEGISLSEIKRKESQIFHLYQSHYAQYFLYKHNFAHVLPLSDYINDRLISNNNIHKENLILYNPSKGYKFTRKLIQRDKNNVYIALIGLSKDELNHYMNRAKLYIDFGSFPGKDRLPREAAMHDCCIITGKNGAANFYEDFPIPSIYKFKRCKSNINNIIQKINFVLDNYEKCINDFAIYKRIITEEKSNFIAEAKSIFMDNNEK